MWYVFWVILSANKPEDHRWISKAEQSYIINSISNEKKRQTITVSQHLLAPLAGDSTLCELRTIIRYKPTLVG